MTDLKKTNTSSFNLQKQPYGLPNVLQENSFALVTFPFGDRDLLLYAEPAKMNTLSKKILNNSDYDVDSLEAELTAEGFISIPNISFAYCH
jgi:hypothetical protein